MIQDPNLPAGCTNADIDRHFGAGDNDMKECGCCGGTGKVLDDGAPDAVPINCPDCEGSGEIEMTDEEMAEVIQDRKAMRADDDRDRQLDRDLGI